MHQLHRDPRRQLVAHEHHWHVCQQHAEGGADHHPCRAGEAGGHGHRGDLRLIAHLGEEEGDQRGAEHAKALGNLRLIVVDLVGHQRPERHADERSAQDPAQYLRVHRRGDPCTQRSGDGMVERCRAEDACNDGQRLLEPRGEQQRQQLGLVANFGEGDHAGRDEECFHESIPGPVATTNDHCAPRPIRRRSGQRSCQAKEPLAPWPYGQVC